jgi:hypothetical protein
MSISDFWQIFTTQAVFTGLLGGLLGLAGRAWLQKENANLNKLLQAEKAKLDKLLQAEKAKLEALLEKSLYMQKVQFDTEFKIYSELWMELCKVRKANDAIHFHSRGNKLDNQSLQGERKNFDAAAESLKSLVENNRPFFAATIAEQLFGLVKLANEARDWDEKDREERGGGMIHAKSVRTVYFVRLKSNDICESIRKRLWGAAAVFEREDDEVPHNDLPA